MVGLEPKRGLVGSNGARSPLETLSLLLEMDAFEHDGVPRTHPGDDGCAYPPSGSRPQGVRERSQVGNDRLSEIAAGVIGHLAGRGTRFDIRMRTDLEWGRA